MFPGSSLQTGTPGVSRCVYGSVYAYAVCVCVCVFQVVVLFSTRVLAGGQDRDWAMSLILSRSRRIACLVAATVPKVCCPRLRLSSTKYVVVRRIIDVTKLPGLCLPRIQYSDPPSSSLPFSQSIKPEQRHITGGVYWWISILFLESRKGSLPRPDCYQRRDLVAALVPALAGSSVHTNGQRRQPLAVSSYI